MKLPLVLLGRLAILLATMAFLASASLFIVGAYMVTWPIMRKSPRGRRKQAVTNLTLALLALAQAFQPEDPPEDR